MTNVEKTKKNKTFYQVLGIIGDIILIPVILIALISSSAMFVARSQNTLPSIFGLSLVFVASESMEPSGFMKGDVLFLTKCDPYSLKVGTPDDVTDELGDVIAFYSYSDPADKGISLNRVSNDQVLTAPDPNNLQVETASERKSVSELPENTKIVFHEVVGRYVDDDGTLFLETKGTGNVGKDTTKIRADYVLGRYSYTPNWLRATFRFCASQVGMILLVVLPLGILILFECFSLIEQTNNMMIEKSVIQGKIRYNAPESLKANVGIEMNDIEKVRFYALASEEDKQGVEDFLWKHLESGSKKEKEEYKFVKKAVATFKTNPEAYFDMWIEKIKGKGNKEKLNFYREEWRIKSAIKEADAKNLKQGEKLGTEKNEQGSAKETTKKGSTSAPSGEQGGAENKQADGGDRGEEKPKLPKRPKRPEEPKWN